MLMQSNVKHGRREGDQRERERIRERWRDGRGDDTQEGLSLIEEQNFYLRGKQKRYTVTDFNGGHQRQHNKLLPIAAIIYGNRCINCV